MVFISDTASALQAAVDLVNTLPGQGREDTLQTAEGLTTFLEEHQYTGTITRMTDELNAIRSSRSRLRELWAVDRTAAVPLVNQLLRDGRALPQLVRHDDRDWHIHATNHDDPLATRILVETAMAFVDVIRSDEYQRIKVCEADDCDAVFVDYSRNRSKLYCDIGNCGNRMNVNAYRLRQAHDEETD